MKHNVFILQEFKNIYMTVTYSFDVKISRWLKWRIRLGAQLMLLASRIMGIPCEVTLERKNT